MRSDEKDYQLTQLSPLGLPGKILESGAANALQNLGKVSGKRSSIAAGRQVHVVFDPTTGVLIGKDFITGETAVSSAKSKNDAKLHLPFGKYQLRADHRYEGWWRLELMDRIEGDDVTQASTNPAKEYMALRMHPGTFSDGCITAGETDQSYKKIDRMLRLSEGVSVKDLSRLYQIEGVIIERASWLCKPPGENRVHGELEVKKLDASPVDPGSLWETESIMPLGVE